MEPGAELKICLNIKIEELSCEIRKLKQKNLAIQVLHGG